MSIKDMYYIAYSDTARLNHESVGGKAYNLIMLHQNGISIPRGVVIPTETLAKKNIEALLNDITEIINKELNAHTYAVRSSAACEDSYRYSWAGCFDTFLDISVYDIPRAILLCKDSLYGKRAIEYQKLHNITLQTQMAVLIQEYCRADVHGVMFTANPISGNENEIIIEFQDGESGNVVGGIGKMTTIVVNKKDNIIRYLSIYENKMKQEHINQLIEMANKIEKMFHHAMDIEWIIYHNEIIVTQSRPITTL